MMKNLSVVLLILGAFAFRACLILLRRRTATQKVAAVLRAAIHNVQNTRLPEYRRDDEVGEIQFRNDSLSLRYTHKQDGDTHQETIDLLFRSANSHRWVFACKDEKVIYWSCNGLLFHGSLPDRGDDFLFQELLEAVRGLKTV